MSAPTPGPQVGDRVKVTITGTVLVRRDGKYPSVTIELDHDIVSAGTVCAECDPSADCEDVSHPARDQVLTFADPTEVVVVERTGGAR